MVAVWNFNFKKPLGDDLFLTSAGTCLSWSIPLDQLGSHCWQKFPNFRNLDCEQLTLNCNVLGETSAVLSSCMCLVPLWKRI